MVKNAKYRFIFITIPMIFVKSCISGENVIEAAYLTQKLILHIV